MNAIPAARRSIVASTLFGLLNPIPFGCFVAALIFDIVYMRTAEIMWTNAAAWLITIGLLFAVVPRMVNLFQVWLTSRRYAQAPDRIDFWINLVAIVLAIINAFVHSRDAYAVVPAGMWLSLLTVVLLAVAHILQAARRPFDGGSIHE